MNVYNVKYKCENCYAAFLVKIPYGEEALSPLDCPNCGVNNVVYKTEKDIQWCSVYYLKGEKLA